jgi:hypothetical protein
MAGAVMISIYNQLLTVTHEFLAVRLAGRDQYEDLDVDERILLK